MEIKKHFCSASEAIREGAKLSRQCVKLYFGDVGYACAYGAAMEAVFGAEAREMEDASELEKLFPYLTTRAPACPECASQRWGIVTVIRPDGAEIRDLIFHLNDDHSWTRERIADWLEKEEEKIGYVTLENVPEIQDTCNSKDSVGSLAQAVVLT